VVISLDSTKCSTYIAVSLANDSTSALQVKYRGVSGYYVCSDHWTSAFSDAVCEQLGYSWVALFVYTHTHTQSLYKIIHIVIYRCSQQI